MSVKIIPYGRLKFLVLSVKLYILYRRLLNSLVPFYYTYFLYSDKLCESWWKLHFCLVFMSYKSEINFSMFVLNHK